MDATAFLQTLLPGAEAGDAAAQSLVLQAISSDLCDPNKDIQPYDPEWLARAARQNQPLAAARLVAIYDQGVLVPTGLDRAMHFCRTAADEDRRPSQSRLGMLLVKFCQNALTEGAGSFLFGRGDSSGLRQFGGDERVDASAGFARHKNATIVWPLIATTPFSLWAGKCR